jgi:hypothetical protein
MATTTAFIIVGDPHPNHGGIIPEHMLQLYENSRPAWVLAHLREAGGSQRSTPLAPQPVWIPTVDGMLEDGLLMLVLHIFQPADLVSLADRMFRCDWRRGAELYDEIDKRDLQDLRLGSRHFPLPGKIVITALMHSHILQQVSRVAEYPWEAEVCTWQYARIRPWASVGGKLPDGTAIHFPKGRPFTSWRRRRRQAPQEHRVQGALQDDPPRP